jgi:hypothetical protein
MKKNGQSWEKSGWNLGWTFFSCPTSLESAGRKTKKFQQTHSNQKFLVEILRFCNFLKDSFEIWKQFDKF